MKVDLKRVCDMVTLTADGTPEELALFCDLAGLAVDGRTVFVQGAMGLTGPKGDKGDTGPAGPQGPCGVSGGLLAGQRGCVCPPGAELGCTSSGCPRRNGSFPWTVTCGIAQADGAVCWNGVGAPDATVSQP